MMILNSFLLVGGLVLNANAGKMYIKGNDFELKKPLVVPAAEVNYHNTMIEVDTLATGQTPLYGLIGVILLDGVFTFSGIEESYLLKIAPDKVTGKRCIPFKGINVVHKCNQEYFALNADFLNIQKTPFQKGDKLSEVCRKRNDQMGANKFNPANDLGLNKKSANSNLVVRFGSRVLMAFKKGANYNKCIGTYDEEDDYFTCMLPKEDGTLVGYQEGSFLYHPTEGKMHRDDNTVEVFCKLPYVYQKTGK
ncbi:hypothetical protein CAEBREN_17756 [Caenorhabditis brenneri]|uniref:Uncharacterized protein n=1 Tax=Caenorhabditis brenneri TaxID=135651 RepID=G0N6M6_CAEBE|nr:hypothetical protein CAEBREN_17756 [Caenorhabditis brenneri]